MYWDSIPQVAGANFTTTSASLVNITGLTFPAITNSLYEVQIVLKVQGTDTNGLRFSVACSASGSSGEFLCISHTASGGSGLTYEANVLGTSNGASKATTGSTDSVVTLYAVVTTTSGTGNITTQCLKVTGGTATVYIGSVMKIKKLA